MITNNTIQPKTVREDNVAKASATEKERLKKACQDFEALFTNQIFKTMRQSGFKSDFIKKGMGEEVFTEMLDSEFSKVAAEKSEGGLGDMLYAQMVRLLPSENKDTEGGNNFPGKNGHNLEEYRQKAHQYRNESLKGSGINIAM